MHIRNVYTYNVVWSGKKLCFRHYTNISYKIFLTGLLKDLGLPTTDIDKYRLILKNQFLSVAYQFPLHGVPDVIYLEEKKGRVI